MDVVDVVELKDAATRSRAQIAPQVGWNCFLFEADVDGEIVDVIDAPADFSSGAHRPAGYGIPVLFPFPNRIRGGRYTWQGRQYVLPKETVPYDPTGNAIHGFCLDRPWRIVAHGDHFAVGRFQLSLDAPDRRNLWPADFIIEMRYELRGPNLRADILIANPGPDPLPWGFGTHPYFRLPLGKQSTAAACLIEVPAAELWELDHCLPTGRRLPVSGEKDLREGQYFGKLPLDDVYTALTPGPDALESLIIDEKAGLQVLERCDPVFREIVAYTPPGRDAVCFEPYTCVTDAINLEERGIDSGLRILQPGRQFTTWIEIRASRVIA